MKYIKTEDAEGHILCHDLTQIVKDSFKGVLFKKGHIVTKDDIPKLLAIGKRNLYIWEKKEGMLHENEAAERIYEACKDKTIYRSEEIHEGKIDLFAKEDGILTIDVDLLESLNLIPDIVMATRKSSTPVRKGDKIAGTRVIPLIIDENTVASVEALLRGKSLFKVIPFKKKTAAIVVTGSEVYNNLIKDAFTPVLRDKLSKYNVTIIDAVIVDDKPEEITRIVSSHISNGVDIILCTGGMSVDPDDTTPTAIKNSGAEVISYGAPVLPGSMFLLAYKGDTTIMGLPGCVMYNKVTIFDIILPRVMADIKVSKIDLAKLGNGGLCLNCDVCTFPICSFGTI